MKSILALVFLAAAASGASFYNVVLEEWEAFKIEHGKQYESRVEEKFRLKIFAENKHKVAAHNKLYHSGQSTYKLGMNKYGDLLSHEFVAQMNGLRYSNATRPSNGATFIAPDDDVVIPSSIDWREKGAVTPVKDQAQCGSCWSFSATGSLEGQHFRQTGRLVSLSEQNLVDCTTKLGNMGCHGGFMDTAFEYIKENGGIDTEESYPYEAQEGECRYNPKNAGAEDVGYVDITRGNEAELMKAVATVGPISVGIDASHYSFQLYTTGVYSEKDCKAAGIDHGVLAVGYGTTPDGQDYWLVKNSWGADWGDEGYLKIARNQNDMCGISSLASYPLV